MCVDKALFETLEAICIDKTHTFQYSELSELLYFATPNHNRRCTVLSPLIRIPVEPSACVRNL